jgi:hypothetical protein
MLDSPDMMHMLAAFLEVEVALAAETVAGRHLVTPEMPLPIKSLATYLAPWMVLLFVFLTRCPTSE